MSLRLIIEDDEGSTTIVPLGSEELTIGRHEGNTIRLVEKNVSRRHARLYPEGDGFCIEDLGSYNGIKVNGQAIERQARLQEGDVVQIGDYHLALTENVDRSTLNYERPPAANDTEPLLASSSTHLPKLTPDELAQLAPPLPAPPAVVGALSDVDSGQTLMASASSSRGRRSRGGAGKTVLFGVFAVTVVVAAAVGGYTFARREGPERPNELASASGVPKAGQVSPPTPGASGGPMPGSAGRRVAPASPAPDPTAEFAPVPAVDPSAGDGGNGGDPEVDDSGAQRDDGSDSSTDREVVRTASPTKSRPERKKEVTKPSPASSPPAPAAEPVINVDDLLADARKQMFKNPAEAYTLASRAYGIKRSQDAAALMAVAACRMRNPLKARRAIGILVGEKRDQAIDVCAANRILIE